jgi:type I restriction enzyme S subunit
VKQGWTTQYLDELFDIGSSKRVLKSQWQSHGVPFYRGREVSALAALGSVQNELFISEELFAELSSKQGVPAPDDIMLTAIGTIGNAYVVQPGDRFYFKDASVLWLANRGMANSAFVEYWLKSEAFRSQLDVGNGATVDTLTIQRLQSMQISLPGEQEQRRLVAILDEAFEGIATAKAHAERNLRSAREVFESRLEQIFFDPDFVWEPVALESIGATQTGSTPKTSEPENYGAHVPFVKPGDFNRDGTIGYENEGLSEVGVRKARLVAAGSALMVCIGATIGKAGYTEREVTTNQQVNAWTPTGAVSGKFIYYQMISKDFQRRVREGAGQATLPIINKSKWSALTVVVPQATEDQKRIVEELDALQADSMSLEGLYQRKLAALDELKQSLLHQAFSGQL